MTFTKVVLALCCLSVPLAAHAAAPANKTSPKMNDLWNDLASSDEARASRALLALAATPKDAVALFAAKLKPVKLDAARVKKLVEQLDHDEFDQREAATRELEYLDRFAKPLLQKTRETKQSPEVTKRIDAILKRLPPDEKDKEAAPKLMGRGVSVTNRNGQIEITIDGKKLNLEAMAKTIVLTPNAQWVRAARAVALLEIVGTPEAQALLRTMAAGEAGAQPTDEAAAALARLAKGK